MNNPILSLSAMMGADIYSGKGHLIGILEDAVWNKDSGKVTYFVVSPHGTEASPDSIYFAIHHSFFYLDGQEDRLIFNPKIGKDDHSFFLDLPNHYDETDVQDLGSFNRYLINHSTVATHRSDNDGLSV